MYTGKHARLRPLQPAFIMASTGEAVTYRELDARCNRLAHLFRQHGLKRLDHYAIFMENNNRYLEACGAGERSGLYFTCVNCYLTPGELAYILNNSRSRILITSVAKLDVAREALKECPGTELCIVADGTGESQRIVGLDELTANLPKTPISDECGGTAMLYSSGTTGRPKGILRPLQEHPPEQQLPQFDFLQKLWHYREGMIYLSPAPLYHSAPQAAVNLTIRIGGTVIIMEKFDPERYLALLEQWGVTHSQLVPTMFSRLLKLPQEARTRYDLSSLEIAIHAAAPCPALVKDDMIKWWGPIIHEYYGATEGLGFTACNSEEWLAHRGTVGKVLLGDLHILDENMQECPIGTPGTVWFKTATPFEYFGDPERTREARSPDGSMSTVGDVGYVDADRYLYLTDRATFMIISGGVNIYPQECENLLITHPKIADAAVFGVPNTDLGEEVKAVVQPMPGIEPCEALADELIAFCSGALSRQKVPRSIDFEDQLPRLLGAVNVYEISLRSFGCRTRVCEWVGLKPDAQAICRLRRHVQRLGHRRCRVAKDELEIRRLPQRSRHAGRSHDRCRLCLCQRLARRRRGVLRPDHAEFPKAQAELTTPLVWRRGEVSPAVLVLRNLVASLPRQKSRI